MSRPSEPISVPALDLKAQYATIRDEIERAVMGVFESQYFILGPEVSALEAEVAALLRARFAVGCASGSDALLLPLMAWGSGRGRGDHVSLHLLRHRRRDLADWGQAGLRGHRPRNLQHRPGPARSGDHASDQGDHPGPPLRPDGRHGPDQRDRP